MGVDPGWFSKPALEIVKYSSFIFYIRVILRILLMEFARKCFVEKWC